ncbi:hypothetical protein AQF52_4058 [Streptomyces venezuelae]|uniref:DUF6344 domain-containing protein n=1 Tax=Streptomyces gardneri TaxID=66892 RepID=UPI0006BDCD42|nr:DUF6344 domain-containing protein [Streptomyces gardneri]ALO09652.1 hypothetical protein AQF52_4058 [Streptomyces venezuelae]QPK46730.1 hypothetical protein H4W23_20250 [Streptomyces gardneri]WRK38128.1 DUF6344 domain-containing protein [Streptomyces venezuelae]CUM39916.1 hypothetical protein BN2537_8797 [Streptomyces venezuelae]
MATAKVKQFWTAFISVLFALLASVGLASTAAAAQQPAVQQPEEPAGSAATAAVPTTGERTHASVPAQRTHRWPLAGDRSLPPTIKQRIGAEAHGSSPSVRHRHAGGSAESDPLALTEPALATAPAAGA